MDILLSHGYFLAEDEHERAIMKPYPPLGLLYVSSHLKARGFDVEVFDSTFEDLGSFCRYLEERRPPIVGLYGTLMTKRSTLAMMRLCREAGTRVVLGGPEPAPYAEHYLRRGVDVVVVGEGEQTLEELIPALAEGGRLDSVDGIVYLDDAGVVCRTPPRAQIADLSGQPWPDRDAVAMDLYLEAWRSHHGKSSVSLITARGCPYTCSWCSHSVFGRTHRRRGVAEVADEVEWIASTYAPDQLWYADDVFTLNRRFTLDLAAELEQRGLRLPFECISRADRLDDEVIAALAEMGCFRLWIGSESGSQRILDAMERRTQVEDIRRKCAALQAAGIEVGMFIMLGYEGEEVSDLEATVEHLKRSSPNVFLTTVAYPIKDTPYYETVADRISAAPDWETWSDRDLRIAGRHSHRFYDYATLWMVSEVNLHQARQTGARLFERARLQWRALRGRWGMRRTRGDREERSRLPAGRGWPARARAENGW